MTTSRRAPSPVSRRPGQAGLTLIELMVSMVITTIVLGAVLALGSTLISSYRVHRTMIEVERSARVSLDILADSVRGASVGVPDGQIVDLVGCGGFGTLRVTNYTDAPDELELIYASGGALTSINSVVTESSTQITVLDGSEFAAGDEALLTNFDEGHVVEILSVVENGVDDWTVTITSADASCGAGTFPTGGYTYGDMLVRARTSHFYVETSPATGNLPTLMMDPDGGGPEEGEPMAQGIEDMQIALGVDLDDDGLVFEDGSSADEWFYNNASDGAPPPITTTPPRALRITLVARSLEEPSDAPTSTRPAVEDHAAAGVPDEFRRRVLAATIEIRNLEGSP